MSSTRILKEKNVTVTTPSQVIGTFTGELVMDRVCVTQSVCATNVEFYTLVSNWGFYNILGLAPVNGAQGPNFVRMLWEQDLISEQRATISMNPVSYRAVTSTLTVGGIRPGLIQGDWYEHKMLADFDTEFDQVDMQLNVTDIEYDGEDIWDDNGVGMVLSSTESNLFLVAGYAKDLYVAWAAKM